MLIGHVGVIADSGELVALVLVPVLIVRPQVDVVELKRVLDVCSNGLMSVSTRPRVW